MNFKNPSGMQVLLWCVICLVAILITVAAGFMIFAEGYSQAPIYVPTIYDLLA